MQHNAHQDAKINELERKIELLNAVIQTQQPPYELHNDGGPGGGFTAKVPSPPLASPVSGSQTVRTSSGVRPQPPKRRPSTGHRADGNINRPVDYNFHAAAQQLSPPPAELSPRGSGGRTPRSGRGVTGGGESPPVDFAKMPVSQKASLYIFEQFAGGQKTHSQMMRWMQSSLAGLEDFYKKMNDKAIRENVAHKKHIVGLESENEGLNEHLNEMREEIQKVERLKKENTELKSHNAELETEAIAAADKIVKLTDRVDVLVVELEETKIKLSDMTEKCDGLEEQIDRLTRDFKAQIRKLEIDVEDLTEEMARVEDDLTKMTEERDKVLVQVTKMKSDFKKQTELVEAEFRKERERLQEQFKAAIAAAEEQRKAIELRLVQVQTEMAKQAELFEEKISEMKAEFEESVREERETQRVIVDSLKDVIEEKNDDIAKLQLSNETLERQVVKLEKDIDKKQAEIDRLRTVVEEQKNMIVRLKKEIAQLRRDLEYQTGRTERAEIAAKMARLGMIKAQREMAAMLNRQAKLEGALQRCGNAVMKCGGGWTYVSSFVATLCGMTPQNNDLAAIGLAKSKERREEEAENPALARNSRLCLPAPTRFNKGAASYHPHTNRLIKANAGPDKYWDQTPNELVLRQKGSFAVEKRFTEIR